MRLLALDFGKARTGVAICDPSGTIVRPLQAVWKASTSDGLASIARMVSAQDVETVVVGLPLELDGAESVQAARTRSFVSRLRDVVSVPVVLHDERFTTRMAERMAGDSEASLDSLAACHLLESYIQSTTPKEESK